MKSVKFSVLAFALAACFSAQATGVNQHGQSNANSQTHQPQLPASPQAGTTFNNGVGIGVDVGKITSTNSLAASVKGGNNKATGGSAKQNQKQSITVESDRRRLPVATAYAAGLAATGPCLGSASGGIQSAAIGISLATTNQDAGCNRRFNAQVLDSFGFTDTAVMLMCEDDSIRQAMTATGRSCAKGGSKVQSLPVAAPVHFAPGPSRDIRDDRG